MPGLDFIAAFWGCLFSGVIAVPVYPVDLRKFKVSVERFGRIVEACEAKLVLTHSKYQRMKFAMAVKTMFDDGAWPEGLEFEITDELQALSDRGAGYNQPKPSDIAFLQFTSGSTGDPKGVMLSHYNLFQNQSSQLAAMGVDSNVVACSWLPQYHDAGLIGIQLLICFCGGSCVLMSPQSFIGRPFLWLQAISKYKASSTCAPNFAYDLCARKVTLEQIDSIDLSHVKCFGNGAEPVTAPAIEAFYDRFKSCGLQAGSMDPMYGMAENGMCLVSRCLILFRLFTLSLYP